MKRAIFMVVLLLLCGAGTGFYLYWTGDRHQLAVLLDRLPPLVRKTAGAPPHEGVLRYAAVDRIFTDPTEIRGVLRGAKLHRTLTRGEMRSLLAMFHRQVRSAEMVLGAKQIRINGSEAAFSFEAEITADFSGQSDAQVLHVVGSAVKSEGRWLIRDIGAEPLIRR